MKKASYFILFLILAKFGITQQETSYQNFHFTKLLNAIDSKKIESEEIIGIMIKGDLSSIENSLSAFKGKYKSSVKGWHYISIPAGNLKDFALKNPSFQFNYQSYNGQPLNDTMRVNNRVNQVHAGLPPLNTPYTGEGVLVGFLDAGVDWRHPDLQFQNGNTRILYLWDQGQAVNSYTPPGYGYGQAWDSSLLNINFPNSTDQWGHGTTVTGTACGNALANGTHKGVAPNTLIVEVKSNFYASNWLATVADAFQYIYDIADSLNMPCVINASVGDYAGSHDGLDPYSLYIDSLITAKKGRLLVAAAGNSGDWAPYHLHTNVPVDTAFSWFSVNPSSVMGNAVFYEIWADTSDFSNVHFAIGADDISTGHYFAGRTNFRTIQNNLNTMVYDTLFNSSNDTIATIQTWAEIRGGQYLLQVYMPSPDSSNYLFRFESFGSGQFDCWSSTNLGTSNIDNQNHISLPLSLQSHYIFPDTLESMVSAFQCSPNVITVGNYDNDSGYVNQFNNWIDMHTIRGKLSISSSKGPTRTGLQKPDVVASGGITNSAYPLASLDYINNNPPLDTNIAYGGMHYRNGGTSMASPVVAGVGALLLEKCPNMTPQEFKTALTNSTYSDGYTGALPNYAYGYGKLDAFQTLSYTNYQANLSGNTTFCFGDSTLISALNYDSILWQDGTTSLTHYFDSTTSMNYITTDSLGCKSDTGTISITEYPPIPTPGITVSFDTLYTISGYNYQWFFNSNLLSGETNQYTIALQNGYYQVEIIDGNNCSSISDTISYQYADIIEIQDTEFKIYPTPANDFLISDSKIPHKTIITNYLGQVVLTSNNLSIRHEMDLNGLSSGVYLIHIITDKKIIVQKFIKN